MTAPKIIKSPRFSAENGHDLGPEHLCYYCRLPILRGNEHDYRGHICCSKDAAQAAFCDTLLARKQSQHWALVGIALTTLAALAGAFGVCYYFYRLLLGGL